MLTNPDCIKPFNHDDAALVAQADGLLDRAFGIGRRAKTSYRLREGERAVEGLSFGLYLDDERTGSTLRAVISFWHLCIGEPGHRAIMLGPIAVEPHLQGTGLGAMLMRHSLKQAARLEHQLVILVGDEPYYAPFGFSRVPDGRLTLPGPVDPARLLFCELTPGAFDNVGGLVLSPSRFQATRHASPVT
ncbi:GNAT family N-acetyltransferase [Anderseniella sp. Alg231-50]|uniref:GNAT family N-acetyltransferase n=1 Tax=Anderseniella sp. Alg231-50 TaxID=1922226 RepID=UPI000D55DE78